MTGKRKRRSHGQRDDTTEKRQKICLDGAGHDSSVKESLLTLYYSQVLSLREYLLSKLPSTSKIRRKKILSVGPQRQQEKVIDGEGRGVSKLSALLDDTLIGVSSGPDESRDERMKQFISFSQREDRSTSEPGGMQSSGGCCQAEVSMALIKLLSRHKLLSRQIFT